MLLSIEGTYRDGQIVLKEPPTQVPTETPVIVTFMRSGEVDLHSQGIDAAGAEQLHVALSTFEDWNEPFMDVYDDYDAATAS